jgi:hypothetical protein
MGLRDFVPTIIRITMGRLYTILTGSMSKPFVTHPNDKPSATMIMGRANTYQLPSGGWPIQAWPA